MGRNSALLNVMSFAAMPVLGLGLALVANGPGRAAPASVIAGMLAVAGGVLLIASKIPRFAAGRVVSFGTAGLPACARVAYVCAYGVLLFSIAALAAALHD